MICNAITKNSHELKTDFGLFKEKKNRHWWTISLAFQKVSVVKGLPTVRLYFKVQIFYDQKSRKGSRFTNRKTVLKVRINGMKRI